MIKNKIGIFLLTMLVSMALIPAVSAQEELTASEKPSEWEQGLIDALNSNTKSLSTDDLILNYCEANKDKISILKNDTASEKNNLRTYELKDGSDITFTNENFFFVTNMTEEPNNKTITQSTTAATSSVNLDYTDTITASQSFYNIMGGRLFTIYSKGYYGYSISPAIVEAHYIDAWYTLGTPTIFQVSNWQEGASDNTVTHISEIYGSGHFHWGFEIAGAGLVLYDKNIKVYSTCDQFGNVHRTYEMT
ncbi:hypothetical protein MSSIT_1784 [Methanosarcina siciliae T4/M]|uniref:Uncharacterized protein n=1 Tax=Methanosarcina siciliae T4/M TaxID=1434120 RepID=A0A0E3P6R9_9EURY|nr:hypothetical protein [Methanosarcina siciliae]AKB28503.1 hypothetical protein MSSIT_1784 [Methanosarcina siciliae T4/M]